MTGFNGPGRVRITYTAGSNDTRIVDLGTVQSITDTVSKQSQPTPIVTQPMQNAFPIEMGNSHTVSVTFSRKNPLNPRSDGSITELSNAEWYQDLTDTIDRWQARTDGCLLQYFEGGTGSVPDFIYQGYIKSITRSYEADFNEVIHGTLEFVVGRMSVNSYVDGGEIVHSGIPQGAVAYKDMLILVSDPEEARWYPLYQGDDDTCISGVTISGGPEESNIEVVTITVPKKRLEDFAPGLEFKDGMNRLKMDFMGSHTGILTKANVSGSQVKLKFYAKAYLYRTMAFGYELTGRPMGIIRAILGDPTLGLTYDLITNAEDTTDPLRFPANTPIWRVLQVCAMYVGAKLFFTDDKAYLLDYRHPETHNPRDNPFNDIGDYDVYASDRATGEVSIDHEGSDPLVNTITVNCSPDGTAYSTDKRVSYNDMKSVDTYGESAGSALTLSELIEGTATIDGQSVDLTQGTDFASRYIAYRAEPQKSVTFSVKESYIANTTYISGNQSAVAKGAFWYSTFGVAARADSIIDTVAGEKVTNRSTKAGSAGMSVPQKLVLSSYTRRYPEGTCEYTFGVISSIDLSESTSQINTSLNSIQRRSC